MIFLPADGYLWGKAILLQDADAMTIFKAKLHETHGRRFKQIVFPEPVPSDVAILLADQFEERAIACNPSDVDFAEGFRELAGVDTELEELGYQTSLGHC